MIACTQAIIFKFDDGLGEHLHHEIAKTEDDWKKTEPFTIFEELQSFLKSNFVYVHQFCKLMIGEEKFEISSRIIYELGDKTLALRNYQVDWMQLLDRQVDVQIECLFRDFNAEQVKNLEKSYLCGGSIFSARELLETSDDGVLLKECLENAEKTLQDYLCYCIKSKISGQFVTVKVCQPSLVITKDVTELQCYIRWITINQFKITSSSVEHERNYLVNGRYELLYRLEYNQKNKSLDEDLKSEKKKEISNPLLNNSDSTTIWVARDFLKRKSIILKIGERTYEEHFLLSKINHPNIIQFNDFYPATKLMSNSFIVFPDMGFDLFKMLKIDNIQLSTSNIRKISEQLVNAVACLHKNNISHRDIKLQNLFFSLEEEHLWLADFDGSSDFTGSKKLSINGYTPKLNEPPEIALESKLSSACDSWGIGVVLYQLLTHDFTTSLVDDFKNGSKILNSKLEALEDKSVKDLIEIVLRCIQYEVDRVSVEELENFQYVSKELNFEENVKKNLAEIYDRDVFLKIIAYHERLSEHTTFQSVYREIVLEVVKKNGFALKYASDKLKSDREIVLEAVKQNSYALEYASDELKSYREIVLTAVSRNGFALKYASDKLKSDREIVLEAFKQNGYALKYASDELKSDRDIMLEIVKHNGEAFHYASDELKSDREIVLEAVKKNGNALYYASDELKSDREIVLAAVSRNGYALEYASYELKSDREIVLEVVKQNSEALKYASDELKSDREIVLTAVSRNGYALEYASNKLKSDREIVLQAVKQNGEAFEYVSPYIFYSDREILLEAVKQISYALKYASDELKSDREIVLQAVKKNGNALEYAPYELKSDREVVLQAVKQNGYAFKYASDELKSDREIVLQAVKCGYSFTYVVNEFKSDREIVLTAVNQNSYALEHTSDELKSDREIVLTAVSRNGYALEYASNELKSDREIVLQAVKKNGCAIEFVSNALKSDRDIILTAVSQNGYALKYASDKLKSDREIVLQAVKQNNHARKFASHEMVW